ncbi:MAG: archease [Deltaproteobacteria bacterium]|nr:archease [Deltaproteobacteria bacterium]MBW2359117.1 archease [Deltaproteobacteria bacterium]
MGSDKPDFSLLDHTADMGILVRGTNLKNLFEEAAKSMMHVMLKGAQGGKTQTIKLSVTGNDLPDLMVRWLGEILYLFEGEKTVATDISVDAISPSYLDATVQTIPFDPSLHEILSEIKAVTYHQIEVAKKGERWEARIIFDL